MSFQSCYHAFARPITLVHIAGIHCHVPMSCISCCGFVYFNLQYCIDTVQYLYFKPRMSGSQHKSRCDTAGTVLYFTKYCKVKNSMNSMKKQTKKYDTERWTSQVRSCLICSWEKWWNSSRRNEDAEPKQKQHQVVGVSGGKSPICQRTILHRNLEY